MKYIKALLLLILLSLTSCEKIDDNAPDCIKELIRKDKVWHCERGASVKQFLFQGLNVYVFEPGTCGADLQAPVYSDNCELLGNLGGFTGNLIINGSRFDQNATFIRTIWTD